MKTLKTFWEILFSNFMWLYFIVGVGRLFGVYIPLLQLFMVVCFMYGATNFFVLKKINALDIMMFIYVAYIIINSIVIDYPHHLRFLIQAFIFQLCPLMCYFIARSNDITMESILKKMLVPITIAMVLGVYFHFTQPTWYTAIKWNTIYERYGEYVSDYNVIEHMRLTSIWNSSYYIAYATLFFSVYLLYSLSFNKLNSKKRHLIYLLLILCVVVLIYANHRATILGFIIAYIYCFLQGKNKNMRIKMLFGAGLIALITINIIFSSPEYFDYISQRYTSVTTEEGLQERLEHTGGEQELFSLFGHGYGRHSLRAREYGWWAIIDSEYQKQLGELGIIGFSMFVIILLFAIRSAFIQRDLKGLELCILLFYIETFLGASALSVDSEYSFIFWYVLGKINQKKAYRPVTTQSIGTSYPSEIGSTIQI